MRTILFKLFPLLILFMGPLQAGLQNDIDKAASTLADISIPPSVLKQAKGIVVMNIVKAGFIFSGKVGAGLVVAHLKEGWSAPSALGTGGVGWGLQAGAEFTDFILVLNTEAALDAFKRGGSITLGGALSVAAGPVGGSAEGSVALPPAAIFAYGRSQGVFAGASLEGAVILERGDANKEFYGKRVTPSQLLSGKITPPDSAQNLYTQLNR